MSHCPAVPSVCALGRWDTGTGLFGFFGGLFEREHDAAGLGLGNAKHRSDFTHGLVLGKEGADVLAEHFLVFLGVFPQVGVFAVEVAELEMDVTAGLDDLADHDVVGTVAELTGSDFELLDIAQAGVLGGFADGKDTVKEVVEFLGAGQVVLGDGAVERALGGVGDDQQGPAVALFEIHELHHEDAGVHAFVRAVAEVGQVVNDGHLAVELQHGLFDVGEDLLFVVGHVEG